MYVVYSPGSQMDGGNFDLGMLSGDITLPLHETKHETLHFP